MLSSKKKKKQCQPNTRKPTIPEDAVLLLKNGRSVCCSTALRTILSVIDTSTKLYGKQ